MALSRRLRFEILRRDHYACRYCGAAAPDTALTVDHVIPVALGGSDEPTNLAAACADCNSGKSSATADSEVIADVKADAVRWMRAMRFAIAELQTHRDSLDAQIDQVGDEWLNWQVTDDPTTTIPRPSDWRASVERFIEVGLPLNRIIEFVDVTMNTRLKPRFRDEFPEWTYFCGCCWKTIAAIQDRAAELLQMEDLSTDGEN